MIEHTKGNLLEADVEALVNTVNTVGVMGRGIALQFRQAFPENYELYRRACKQGEVRPGEMFVTQPADQLSDLRYIINFPTKRDWRGKARTEDVETGLVALVDFVRDHEVRSIAIPPLGCGNGGLQWSDVRPKIEAAFASLPQVRVLLYAPEGAPNADKMRVTTKRPNMTLVRAALIALLDRYERPGYRTTLLEVQKLGYFLKSAGEPLPRMEFTRNRYGPYAKTLEHLLRNVEGHFLRGYGDGSEGPSASLHVLQQAVRDADLHLEEHPETRERLERVARLIEGFETPYGLELLSTVHFLAQEDSRVRGDVQAAVQGVHSWSERKKGTFCPEHIETAWQRLREQGWI